MPSLRRSAILRGSYRGDPMKKNAFYAQSGGVTAVINASACGVIETARKLGCDEDKERFEESLGNIAAYKPPKKPKAKKAARR